MKRVAILGSGIAGLSVGYWLEQTKNIDYRIFERNETYGGLARSFKWHDFNCDFATHRFYTTDEEVRLAMLTLVPMSRHIRRSKLFILDSWVNDPINPTELFNLIPIKDKFQLFFDLVTQKNQIAQARNFKDYVIQKFGKYMFEIFFRPYTEKLFGLESENISTGWARNKVRLKNPFRGNRQSKKNTFSYFYYPVEGGYGVIADTLYQQVKDRVSFNCTVTAIKKQDQNVAGIEFERGGEKGFYACDTVISTLPLSVTSQFLGEEFTASYRAVSSVYLWINKPHVMDYHWVYFIPDTICINRLAEFKNLNPLNAPPDTTVICAEVTQQHENVGQKVIEDLVRVGLIKEAEILDMKIIQERFGYPVYEIGIEDKVDKLKEAINHYSDIRLVGRSAEFIHREVDDIFGQAKTVADSVCQQDIIQERPQPKMEKNKVCVVVLSFNNFTDTAECLESLQHLNDEFHTTIVIDNGSTDGSPEKISQHFPDVKLIALEENIGVPAGFNQGIQVALNAGYEYVFILNNDTVVAPDMLLELIKVAEKDENFSMAMPQILYYPPSSHKVKREDIWSDGGYYRKFPPGIVHKDNRKAIDFSQPRLVEYVPTCGLLIHKRAFQQVGLFDPGYFFFFEDWDFSERVRSAGLTIWSVPTAKMWHKVSKTTKVNSDLYWRTMGESTIRFFRRHYSLISSLLQISYRVFRDLIFAGNIRFWKPFFEGVRKGMSSNLDQYPDISSTMAASEISGKERFDEI